MGTIFPVGAMNPKTKSFRHFLSDEDWMYKIFRVKAPFLHDLHTSLKLRIPAFINHTVSGKKPLLSLPIAEPVIYPANWQNVYNVGYWADHILYFISGGFLPRFPIFRLWVQKHWCVNVLPKREILEIALLFYEMFEEKAFVPIWNNYAHKLYRISFGFWWNWWFY